jgi:parallel beta-helix repeat protein
LPLKLRLPLKLLIDHKLIGQYHYCQKLINMKMLLLSNDLTVGLRKYGMASLFLLFSVSLTVWPVGARGQSPSMDCNYLVTAYGAKGDGAYNSQGAIQRAIDECAANGGGEVCFPTGHYVAPEVVMKDNVRLRFDRGSRFEGAIVVEGVYNTGIIGHPAERLNIIGPVRFAGSEELVLKHIFSRNGWVLRDCRAVTVEDVKIEQEMRRQANGVAITFVDGRDIFVTDSELTCNDDAFCLKRSAENVHITNSLICGRQAASFKIGTETDGLFRNISMTNCVIYNSNRAGINIEAVDGADIDGVRISGIQMYNVAAPFYIRLGNRDRYAKGIGSIRNIDISDIHFVGMQHDEGIGSSIMGLPGHPVENVSIRNVHITTHGGGTKAQAAREVPPRENFYPEYDIYGILPAYGFFTRHVRGLKLSDITLSYAEPDLRPAVLCEETSDLAIERLRAQHWIPKNQYVAPFAAPEPLIVLEQVRHALIRDNIAPVSAPLAAVRGGHSTDIALVDNRTTFCLTPPYAIGSEVEGWLTLSPTAKVEVQELTAPKVKAGEPFAVQAKVANTGAAGYARLELSEDGELSRRKWVWMEAGATTTVSFDVTPGYQVKDRRFRLGSKSRTVRPAPAAPELAYQSLEAPSIAALREQLPVRVSVRNTGSEPLRESVRIRQGEKVIAARTVALAAGASTTVELPVSFSRAGRYELLAGDFSQLVSVNPIWIDADKNGKLDRREKSFAGFPEALRAAEAGDLILVQPGHFTVDSSDLPLLIDQPGLTIRSVAGYEQTRIQAVDADEEAFEKHSLFHVAADDVTIEGFTLSTAVFNIYVKAAKGTKIQHNFFDISRRYHLYLEDVAEVEITENRSRVGRYNFLTMRNGTGCTIRDNYHNEDPCGYTLINSHNNTMIRNHFDSLSWFGITFLDSNDNLVEDNLFEGGRILGFQCRSSCENNRILRNTFLGNRTEAILLTGDSKNNVITQNNILDNRGLALTNESANPVDAGGNWWGSADGPAGAGPGSGDSVDERVTFDEWLKGPVENSWKVIER